MVYLESAKRAAEFIKANLYDSSTHVLKRVYLDGPGETDGFSDDYGFLISGLIELYQATFDVEYLKWADALQKTQLKLFWDDRNGGLFRTSASSDEVILRMKDDQDAAEPSSNSLSSMNLLRLGSILGDRSYDEKAVEICQSFGDHLNDHPWIFPGMLMSLVGCLHGMREIVVIGKADKFISSIANNRLLVNTTVIVLDRSDASADAWLLERNDILKEALKLESDGNPFVTICQGYSCGKPIMDLESLNTALES